MVVIILIILIILILLGIWTWYHPESILLPLNLLYNTDPSPRTNFYTEDEKNRIFPVSRELESIWQDIRKEGYDLYESLPDKNMNYLDNYHINIGDETKRQWTTIPLRLFGRDYEEYMNPCPIITKILRDHPEIKSCLFSIMEPGKIINPHVGPYDGLLRYQLALSIPKINLVKDAKHLQPEETSSSLVTPNADNISEVHNLEIERGSIHGMIFDHNLEIERGSIHGMICDHNAECYLHVGGERYNWIEGKGIMFDEANLHGAINTTTEKRMVLLIDLERPYSFLPYRLLNKGIIWSMGLISPTSLKI